MLEYGSGDRVCLLQSVGESRISCNRKRKNLRWDPNREVIVGDPEASRMLSRCMREPWRLGG